MGTLSYGAVVGLVLFVLAIDGGRGWAQTATPHSPFAGDSIVVLDGARNINHSSDYDGRVTYDLADPFPATRTLELINYRFKAAGWRQTGDLFNPRGETKLRDWGVVEVNGRMSMVWTAYWTDKVGNIVSCGLSYDLPSGGNAGPREPLYVSVIRFSRATADALRKNLKRY